MHCTVCDTERQPVHEVTDKGIRAQCPVCTAPMFDFSAQPAAPVQPETVVPHPAPRAPAKPAGDALALVDQLRARLAFVDEEIAKRDGYLAEREMLRRMIGAAEDSTKPALPLN